MDKIIVIDAEKCMACLTCEIECSLAHSKSKTLYEVMNEVEPRISVEEAGEFAVPMVCRHCEDAPCIKICPTNALMRQDQNAPVLLNKDLCIGCKFCINVCPFGAIVPSYDGRTVVKCDMCIDRLKAGQKPACVASCPMDAIEFIDAEQYAREKRKTAAKQYLESAGQ